MLSPGADGAAAAPVAVDVRGSGAAGVAESAADAPAGTGVVATSPALTPERGASPTQAVRIAKERTPAREERTEDMR